jgi:hypothetical protein
MKEYRERSTGVLRLMALADGYAMVRHPGCLPFVMSQRDWEALPIAPAPGKPSRARVTTPTGEGS